MNKRPSVVGTVTEPLPLRLTVCGEFVAESVSVSVADRAPAAIGVKLTEIVQLVFAGSVLAQVCPTTLKSLSPDIAALVMLNAPAL
jgi:hypothetical protein